MTDEQEHDTNTIYTIGHSDRSLQSFLEILFSYDINHLADVRRYPSSKKFPHFNQGNLKGSLTAIQTSYYDLGDELGGYVNAVDGADEIEGWEQEGFQNYAAYTKTDKYKQGLEKLQALGRDDNTVFMCAEGWYRKCHRQIIADSLTARGWDVRHISSPSSDEPHQLPEFAQVTSGEVLYRDPEGTETN